MTDFQQKITKTLKSMEKTQSEEIASIVTGLRYDILLISKITLI